MTVENFRAWKAKFDKELAAKKAKEEEEKLKGMTPKEREEYKRLATRLTGSASRCEIWRCVLTGFRPSTLRARPESGH